MTEYDAEAHAELNGSIIAGIERMLAESRSIDTRAALEGITARRLPPRSRRHSVRHKAIR
jgi:hypothetical protein